MTENDDSAFRYLFEGPMEALPMNDNAIAAYRKQRVRGGLLELDPHNQGPDLLRTELRFFTRVLAPKLIRTASYFSFIATHNQVLHRLPLTRFQSLI